MAELLASSFCGPGRLMGISEGNVGRQQRVASGGPSVLEGRRPCPVHMQLPARRAASSRLRPAHLRLTASDHLGLPAASLSSTFQPSSSRLHCCQVQAGAGIVTPGEVQLPAHLTSTSLHSACGSDLPQCRVQDKGLRGPLTIPTHGMAGGLGSFGGATLERSKLDTKREQKVVEPRLDDAGGGGGIGKGLSNGGGGDDDGGDDDDYGNGFGEGGDDGEGDGFFRAVLQQLYNPEALKAVLTEFSMTMSDLPAMLRQSVEMGLFSSAMLHTFLTTDVRPSLTRAVTRSMPQKVGSWPHFYHSSAVEFSLQAFLGCLIASAILMLSVGEKMFTLYGRDAKGGASCECLQLA